MNKEFLKDIQDWAAKVSISPSTVPRVKGTMGEAITFLQNVDLSKFGACKKPEDFDVLLKRETEKLKNKLPNGKWGVARKCLNIFLRDATYNYYLREGFNLSKLESWLEVPLDSHVGKALRKKSKTWTGESIQKPPPWKSIVGLKENDSNTYQNFAEKIAKLKTAHKCRVHLDAIYWREEDSGHKRRIA